MQKQQIKIEQRQLNIDSDKLMDDERSFLNHEILKLELVLASFDTIDEKKDHVYEVLTHWIDDEIKETFAVEHNFKGLIDDICRTIKHVFLKRLDIKTMTQPGVIRSQSIAFVLELAERCFFNDTEPLTITQANHILDYLIRCETVIRFENTAVDYASREKLLNELIECLIQEFHKSIEQGVY